MFGYVWKLPKIGMIPHDSRSTLASLVHLVASPVVDFPPELQCQHAWLGKTPMNRALEDLNHENPINMVHANEKPSNRHI